MRAASHALRAGGRTAAVLPRAALALPPRFRRRLLVILVAALALAALYQFWFRDSSFVRVQKVTVTGLSGTDAPRHRAALIAAAHGMTTLHVDVDALRRAMGAGATVDIPAGATVTVSPNVSITVKGTLKVVAGATHAKLTGANWGGLVIAQGGRVWVDSEEGKGSEFSLALPVT